MTDTAAEITVQTLDHVTIVVRDLDLSRDFYVGTLGMREVERPGFSFAGKWFQAGDTQIHLILEHGDSGAAGAGASTTSRGHHFAFQVDDAHMAANRLRERGVPIADGPKSRPDGAVQVFVNDPDGHLVELCSLSKR